jgi:hypothetical protein
MGSRLVDDQVVELRVHGVSGTPPERMLDDPHPQQVAGDADGRVFRRPHPLEAELGGSERVVEAFHWGRFTAGSATRALWLLLLPFAVVNLARYALLMVASILPALVLTLVWWFGRQSFQHDPPGPKREPEPGNGSFADLMFWRGAASAPLQRAAHAMAGCAVLGAMAVGVLGDPAQWLRDHGSWDDRIYLGLLALCGVLFLVALAWWW